MKLQCLDSEIMSKMTPISLKKHKFWAKYAKRTSINSTMDTQFLLSCESVAVKLSFTIPDFNFDPIRHHL